MTYREGMSKDQLAPQDVAELAGVTSLTIHRYKATGKMPKPDGVLGRTPWWHRATIDKWLAERPKPGRPPKTQTSP